MDSRTAVIDRLHRRMDALQERHRWTDRTVLRLSAVALAAIDDDDVVERVSATAATLKELGRMTEPFSGNLRFVLAAMIVRRGLDPAVVVDATRDVRGRFKGRRLSRSGSFSFLAAFLLVVLADGRPVADEVLDRMAELIRSWKKDHPFLTGQDDYPMAALHASHGEAPEVVSRRVEAIYTHLASLKFGKGEGLQLASHLLGILPGEGLDAAVGFQRVAEALRERGVRTPERFYDEVALLALIGGDASSRVAETLEIRDAIRDLNADKGWWKRLTEGVPTELAFSMAVGVTLALAAPSGGRVSVTGTTAVLTMAQAVLEAQQAAAVVCIAAGGAAAASAAS